MAGQRRREGNWSVSGLLECEYQDEGDRVSEIGIVSGCTEQLNPCETLMVISTVRSKLFTLSITGSEEWMLPRAALWLAIQ